MKNTEGFGKDLTRLHRSMKTQRIRAVRETAVRARVASGLRLAGGPANLLLPPREARDSARVMRDLDAKRQSEALVPADWIGPEPTLDPSALAFRARAAALIVHGLQVAFSGDPAQAQTTLEDFTRIALSFDPYSRQVGDLFVVHPIPVPTVPPLLARFEDLLFSMCIGDFFRAGAGDPATYAERKAAREKRRAFLNTARIEHVSPDHGCAGTIVTLTGSGFGDTQPQGIGVMFGGCVAAQVVVSWTETQIQVEAPPAVGIGCIGFSDLATAIEAESTINNMTTTMEGCLGPAAAAHIAVGRDLGANVSAFIACPPCLDDRTRFLGGPPVIRSFTIGGRHDVATFMPGAKLSFAWRVENAQTVRVDASPEPATLVKVSGPQPATMDDLQVGPFDQVVDGDIGHYTLSATNECGTTTKRVNVVVAGRQALVIAGGGTKGAFSVGAVRCIQDVLGIKFDIISGTSVGAINAAKLAEGGSALYELVKMWESMLYQWQFFFASELFTTILRLKDNAKAEIASLREAAWSSFGSPIAFLNVIGKMGYFAGLATELENATELASMAPIQAKIRASISEQKVAGSGILLRVTAADVTTYEAVVFDQNGGVLGKRGLDVLAPHRVSLHDAVIASASIPFLFPAIQIKYGGEEHWFVDGGLIDMTPIAAAVDAGAHRVIAITHEGVPSTHEGVPSAVGGRPLGPDPLTDRTLLAIGQRAFEVVRYEMQHNDIHPYRGPKDAPGFNVPVQIVAPSMEVHSAYVVDPALISINMDYGYMRAFDALKAPPDQAERDAMCDLSDKIATARTEASPLEARVNYQFPPPQIGEKPAAPLTAAEIHDLRNLKRNIADLVSQRVTLGGKESLPSHPERWFLEWERHAWPPVWPSPWGALQPTSGEPVVPAEAPPPAP